MKDRTPTMAGRIRLSIGDETAPQYYYMAMADEPSEPGTPLNKNTLLSDTADSSVFGSINANHTVSDAFYELGSSRIRPYNNKLYTCYPDLDHPFIEFSEHFGKDAKSHIVVTKDYYVYQSSINTSYSSNPSITFKVFAKSNTSSPASTFSITENVSDSMITVDSIKGDQNGNIIEIHYAITGSDSSVNTYSYFIDVSNTSNYYHTVESANQADRPYLLWQNSTYYWYYRNNKTQGSDDYRCFIARMKVSDFSSAGNAYELTGTSSDDRYGVSKIICDGTYFYIFTDHYSTPDSDTGNYTIKILRFKMDNLSISRFRLYNDDTPWSISSKPTCIPHWIEDGTFYIRVKDTSSQYHFYSASINENQIVFHRLSSTQMADTDTYIGHIASDKALFIGITGTNDTSNFRVVSGITTSSATIGSKVTSSIVPNGDKQYNPVLPVRSKVKHILPSSPVIPAGVCGSIEATDSYYKFKPIYAAQTAWNVWSSCSVYSVNHSVDNTDKISYIVSSPSQFTLLTTNNEKSDIRYLPGYFREGRV